LSNSVNLRQIFVH